MNNAQIHNGKQLQHAVSKYKSKVTGFAKAIGIERSTAYDWFRLEVLSQEQKERSASVLGYSVEVIFNENEPDYKELYLNALSKLLEVQNKYIELLEKTK